MKNLGFVALLALLLGTASAFTTSSKTAALDPCQTTSGSIDNECPFGTKDCCVTTHLVTQDQGSGQVNINGTTQNPITVKRD